MEARGITAHQCHSEEDFGLHLLTAMAKRPDRDEAADYYFRYIDLVPDGDICELLATQSDSMQTLLQGITTERSLSHYAPDKWTVRDVVNHVSDCERLFVGRAFWFARGFETPLPSFDQHVAMTAAHANQRPWPDIVAELVAVRAGTVTFFRGLPPEAWNRRGIASDDPFSVRALGYLALGHASHHVRVLQERYSCW